MESPSAPFRGNIVSDVPHSLLVGKTPDEVWMYDQQSIQRQLSERILKRLDEDESRFSKIERDQSALETAQAKLAERIEPFEKLKEQWTGKRAVLSFLGTVLLLPVALVVLSAVLGGLFLRAFEKWWK